MTYQTWLLWNRQTGALLLEVEHVPVSIQRMAVAAILSHFGYWPVDVSGVGHIDGLESSYIEVEKTWTAPAEVRRQLTIGHRRIEWRQMWEEMKTERQTQDANVRRGSVLETSSSQHQTRTKAVTRRSSSTR